MTQFRARGVSLLAAQSQAKTLGHNCVCVRVCVGGRGRLTSLHKITNAHCVIHKPKLLRFITTAAQVAGGTEQLRPQQDATVTKSSGPLAPNWACLRASACAGKGTGADVCDAMKACVGSGVDTRTPAEAPRRTDPRKDLREQSSVGGNAASTSFSSCQLHR